MRISAVVALILIAAPATVRAQDAPVTQGAASLTVRGTGEYWAKPDFAKFALSVSGRGQSLGETIDAQAERASRALVIIKNLEQAGLKLEASQPFASEQRASYAPGANPAEYVFIAGATFDLRTTRLDQLDIIFRRINEAGLFQTSRVEFKVDQERAALNEARRAAVTDARQQAAAYSDAADLKLLEIVSISDGEARLQEGAADMPIRGISIPIAAPAKIRFEASVTLTWRAVAR